MLFFEIGLALLVLLIAFVRPTVGSKWFAAIERQGTSLARRRALAILAVGLLPILIRLTLLYRVPFPVPAVHDEFSYLLAADTFAHGRLTNPPHPMWKHFETFHVQQQPTYASMYFPAQGLFLALGQVLFGHPYYGVLISVGLMCGAICWMLYGWVPARWALLGGLLAVMRFGIWGYWANSYWGGAAAAAGGALVLGALPRIIRRRRLRDALIMGIGLALLANSRPYEGLVYSLPFAAALLIWMLGKKRPPAGILARRVVIPISFILALSAAGMGYYFYRVTGSPIEVPETLNLEAYHEDRLFFWQSPGHPPPIHDLVMKKYYDGLGRRFLEAKKIGIVGESITKLVLLWRFFLGPILFLPLLAWAAVAPAKIRWSQVSPRLRFLFITFVTSTLGLCLETTFEPHYAAPMTGLTLLIVLESLRYLRLWQWRGKSSGAFLSRAVPLSCFVLLALPLFHGRFHLDPPPQNTESWCCEIPSPSGRHQIERKLRRMPGRELVFVQYSSDHDPIDEWVYNGADIDDQKIVWARDMGQSQNQELIDYYKDRSVWLVEVGGTSLRLVPYPDSER